MSKVFLDTNYLIYSIDGCNPVKRDRCRQLLTDLAENGNPVISTQVLQEFYVASTRKLSLKHIVAKGLLQSFKNFEVVTVDVSLIEEATDCSALSKVSFWDALIVVSASKAGCPSLWTEDLNTGQIINGVRVENPLAS